MTARFQSTCSVRSKTSSPCYNNHVAGNFNPLAPCGARRIPSLQFVHQEFISIHLLRAEQDNQRRIVVQPHKKFQSTCSVRSKTLDDGECMFTLSISIHLLRAEQDMRCSCTSSTRTFQSTCSVRSKTANGHKNCLQRSFILHRSPPHKSNKRDFQQKKEPSRRKNGISLVRTHPGFGVN